MENDVSQRILNPIQPRQEGKKLFQYLSTFIAGLIAVQSGMALGWTSPILPYLTSKESFLTITNDQVSWITSLLAVGAFVGAVPAGKVADLIGRKRAIVIQTIPFLLSWSLLSCAWSVDVIYIARFIGGIGSGAAFVLIPIYIGEIAEASIRGALGVCFSLFFALGTLYSYIVGAYVSYTLFNLSCALLLLPFLACISFLPESPVWLVNRGLMAETGVVLEILRGSTFDAKKRELSSLRIEAREHEHRNGGIHDLLGTRAGRKALVTCLGLMAFQQLSGIDAVLFYTVSIFQDAGSTVEPFIASIVIGLIEIVMTIVTAFIIDRFGRKVLLVGSGATMAICLGILGYYFELKSRGTDVIDVGWIPLACLALYNVVFSVGYGAVPFAMIGELFPPETKGIASSLSIMTNWALVFAVTKLFPTMENGLGRAFTFWIFGFLMAVASVFALVAVPETKGKSLRQIQAELAGERTTLEDGLGST